MRIGLTDTVCAMGAMRDTIAFDFRRMRMCQTYLEKIVGPMDEEAAAEGCRVGEIDASGGHEKRDEFDWVGVRPRVHERREGGALEMR